MIHRAGAGIAFALAAASLYGLIPSLARAGFDNGIAPVEATFVRTSVIAVALAAVAVARAEPLVVPRAAWASFLAQALATAAVSVSYLASIQFIPVGLAVIIFFTFPVLILLAAPVVEGHRPGLSRLAIALVAFTGLAIAVGPSFERLDLRGILLAGLAAFAAGLQFFSGRAMSRYMTPAVFGSLVHFVIWPVTLVIALWAGGGVIRLFPGGMATGLGYGFLAALACVYTVAYAVQMMSLRNAPASVVAPFFNLEPVVTTIVAALALGERLDLNQYAGGSLVLAALIASNLHDRATVRRAPALAAP